MSLRKSFNTYNVFFEVFASDIPACQEMLRTIIEDDDLIVKDVIVQNKRKKVTLC